MIRNSKGFTLIELMVVILIIGILAALAIPKFTNASAKAKVSEIPTVCAAYENAQMARVAETGKVGALAELVFDVPGDSGKTKWFTWTSPSNGEYEAATINPVGGFSGTATTQVDSLSQIKHSTSDSVTISKLLPNFLK